MLMNCHENYEKELLRKRFLEIIEDISKRGPDALEEHLDEMVWLTCRIGSSIEVKLGELLNKEMERAFKGVLESKSPEEAIPHLANFFSLLNIKRFVIPIIAPISAMAVLWPLLISPAEARYIMDRLLPSLVEEAKKKAEEATKEAEKTQEEIEEELKTRWYRV